MNKRQYKKFIRKCKINEKYFELIEASMSISSEVLGLTSLMHKDEYIKKHNIVDKETIKKIYNDEINIYGNIFEKVKYKNDRKATVYG